MNAVHGAMAGSGLFLNHKTTITLFGPAGIPGIQKRLATADLNPPWKFWIGSVGEIRMAGTAFCLHETWDAAVQTAAVGREKPLSCDLPILDRGDVVF
jgi:hypothetical protein